jgi:hypothetical protein
MKYIILLTMVLTGCAGGGSAPSGSTTAAPVSPAAPVEPLTIKPVNSIWTSYSDQEQFDLRSVPTDSPTNAVVEMHFIGSDGRYCGIQNIPGESLVAEVTSAQGIGLNKHGTGWDFHLRMLWSHVMYATPCQDWAVMPDYRESNVYMIRVGADMRFCHTFDLPEGSAVCKLFH